MSAPTVENDERAPGEQGGATDAYGVGRLLAFSDGVFAIAITLLVLSIPVPDIPHGLGIAEANTRLAAGLGGLVPSFAGFALSFFLVGSNWLIHHRVFRNVARTTRPLLWINLLILLGICLVPFATNVLVRYGDTPTGVIAYAAVQTGIALAYFALRLHLATQRIGSRRTALVGLIQVVGFAASIPFAFANVYIAYGLWLAGFALARALDGRLQADRR